MYMSVSGSKMEHLTLTSLRKNLFQVADQVLNTGEPVIIERHGRRLALIAEPTLNVAQRRLNLDNLPRRSLFNGNSDELAEFKAWDSSEWQTQNNHA